MANIPVYENKDNGLAPSTRGSQAFEIAGRRIGGFYQQQAEDLRREGNEIGSGAQSLGRVVEASQTAHEISQASAASAATFSQLSEDYQNTLKNADPNNPNTTSDWMQKTFEPSMAKLNGLVATQGGKRYVMSVTDQWRQHFTEKALADQSTMAGQAAVQNAQGTINSYTSIVANDFTSLDTSLGVVKQSMAEQTAAMPHVTADMASKINDEVEMKGSRQLVTSAYHGAADRAAIGQAEDSVRQLLTSSGTKYDKYITSEEKESYLNYAREVDNHNRVDQTAGAMAEAKRQTLAFKQDYGALYASGLNPADNSWTPTPDYIKNLAALAQKYPLADDIAPLLRESIASVNTAKEQAINHTLVSTDQATYNALSRGAWQDPNTPGYTGMDKILAAYNANQLSNKDKDELMTMAKDASSNPARRGLEQAVDRHLQDVKSSITKSSMIQDDQDGDRNYDRYQFNLHQLTAAAVNSGMSPGDVQKMYLDPTSPQYFGKRIASEYTINMKQAQQALIERAAGILPQAPTSATTAAPAPAAAPIARLPNETPAAYLKRTGG